MSSSVDINEFNGITPGSGLLPVDPSHPPRTSFTQSNSLPSSSVVLASHTTNTFSLFTSSTASISQQISSSIPASSSSSSQIPSTSSAISSTITLSSSSISSSNSSTIAPSSALLSPTPSASNAADRQGVAPGSYNSNSMCDTTCIIAISTILGGVTLILLALGTAWFVRRKLRERRAASIHPNHSAAAVGKEPMRDASTSAAAAASGGAAAGFSSSKARSTDEESGYGFTRRATEIAMAVRAQLPARLSSAGLSEEERERGRERYRERVDRARYEGLASRDGSRPEGERPSRGMGWAV